MMEYEEVSRSDLSTYQEKYTSPPNRWSQKRSRRVSRSEVRYVDAYLLPALVVDEEAVLRVALTRQASQPGAQALKLAPEDVYVSVLTSEATEIVPSTNTLRMQGQNSEED